MALVNDQCVTNWQEVAPTLFTSQCSNGLLNKNDCRMIHYQPLSLNATRITSQLAFCWTLTLLAGTLYDCSDRCRLTGFTNDNSPIQDGQRYAGVAVVSNTEIIWSETQLAGLSAWKAELGALKKSLELRKDKTQMSALPLLSLISMGSFIRRGAFWWERTKFHPREKKESPIRGP